MTNLKAIIFDADGTLLDSFSAIVGAYQYIGKTLGTTIPTVDAIHGHLRAAHPLPQIMQSFFPGHELSELLRLNNAYITSQKFQPFEGVAELLRDLHEQGIALAILTAGDHTINQLLELHELQSYFTSVVHCNRITFSKPHAEGVLLAVEECGVRPEQAIMVGDSSNDIQAGKNAHVGLTIGIVQGHASRDSLLAADPDYVVDSISALRQRLLGVLA